MIEIKNRWNGDVICSGKSLLDVVKANLANLSWADLSGANLSRADLSGADLSWANLSGADLSGVSLSMANLSGVNLSGADLSWADLSGANLSRANLSRANLSGVSLSMANLSGVNLSRADLSGARVAWRSHDMIAEILRRAAGDDIAKLKVAGFILIMQDKCWREFIAIRDPLTGWARSVLEGWIQEGDDLPDIARAFFTDKQLE